MGAPEPHTLVTEGWCGKRQQLMKRHFIVNIDCHTAETFTKERAQLHKRTDSEMRKGGGLVSSRKSVCSSGADSFRPAVNTGCVNIIQHVLARLGLCL